MAGRLEGSKKFYRKTGSVALFENGKNFRWESSSLEAFPVLSRSPDKDQENIQERSQREELYQLSVNHIHCLFLHCVHNGGLMMSGADDAVR